MKKNEKVSLKNDDGFNFTYYGLTYLRALDCPKLYSYKIGNGNSVFLHLEIHPKDLVVIQHRVQVFDPNRIDRPITSMIDVDHVESRQGTV